MVVGSFLISANWLCMAITAKDTLRLIITLRSCASIPGRIMMTDTMVPSSRKKENTSRVTVELLEEGQHPHRRHGAEPHRQEAYGRFKNKYIYYIYISTWADCLSKELN